MKNLGLTSLAVVALGIALYICVAPRAAGGPPATLGAGAMSPLDRTEAILFGLGPRPEREDAWADLWMTKVRADGSAQWSQKLDPRISRVESVRATNDTILVQGPGANSAVVVALSRATGAQRWSVDLDSGRKMGPHPLVVDGDRVYKWFDAKGGAVVHALSIADGTKLWSRKVAGRTRAIPRMGSGRLLLRVGADDEGEEVDGATGETIRPVPFSFGCALSNGAFIAVSKTHAFVVHPGKAELPKPLFELPAESTLAEDLCGERGGDVILATRRRVDGGSVEASDLRRIDPVTGAVAWTITMGTPLKWVNGGEPLPRFVPFLNGYGDNYLATVDLDRGVMTKQDIETWMAAAGLPTEHAYLSTVFTHRGHAFMAHPDAHGLFALTRFDPETGELLDVVDAQGIGEPSGRDLSFGQFWLASRSRQTLDRPSWALLDLASLRVLHAQGDVVVRARAPGR